MTRQTNTARQRRGLVQDVAERTTQTAIRLPLSLVGRIDAYAAWLATEHPGMRFTRADAIRMLLTRALDAANQDAAR